MTRARRTAFLSAATIVAALGLGACASDESEHPAATSVETSPAPSVGLPAPPPVPDGPPLPPPEALTDVLGRLTDPGVAGAEKVGLIEGASVSQADALDRFAIALRDNRALPLTFEARDLRWSASDPDHVIANVVIATANPGNGAFTSPMEFARTDGAWQLTRTSADQLLHLDAGPTPPSPAGPTPPSPADPPR
ncbi:hypothetical protein [Mycobacterium sp. SMC-4]|uniref:hypothetical protein n=1 Tax=Mycobacterium sp. SMC-4 TaxID=2857059 RepID=UPI003CFE8286